MMKERDLDSTAMPEFKTEIDAWLSAQLEHFYKSIKGADHLLKSDAINKNYYRRHVIEIILRLRMKRVIDALTIHYFTKTDPYLAKKWAQYTEDEMLHDEMFAKDLERLGVSKSEIYATDPLFTTKVLQGYFYYGLEHEGKPLASLCSSYFIETMSIKTQRQWIENIERNFGTGIAKGQNAHVAHDLEDDHVLFVWNVLMTLVKTEEDKQKIREHLSNVATLFSAFYAEMTSRYLEDTENKDNVVRVLAAA